MRSVAHTQTGLILEVNNFDACVAFYRDLFGLRVMHEKSQGDFRLVCLGLGSGYLMIETAPAHPQAAGEKRTEQSLITLRFNVPDIAAALEVVHEHGTAAHIEAFDWGSTIRLTDPDGNSVCIRDAPGFDDDNARFRASESVSEIDLDAPTVQEQMAPLKS